MTITNIKYLSKGRRGIVSIAELDGNQVVIKESNPTASTNSIEHEARILRQVNAHGIGPTFIRMEGNNMVSEFIAGQEILLWLASASTPETRRVLLDVLAQCRTLDLLGISKREMTRPYKHILIRDNKPVQIDFERARETKRPQNVTQCCQWISNSRMHEILTRKGIRIDREKLRVLAKTYKERYDEQSYDAIASLVAW